MSAPVLRPASTVVLLRPAANGLEVFLVRRHGDIAFMGGAHVFPGGRVDEADADERYTPLADGLDSVIARMKGDDALTVRASCVAAIRETFEEAGVLLARGADGEVVSLPQSTAEVARLRLSVSRSPAALLDLLYRHAWRLALDELVYFAHWVTPDIETRRFDTRFFLAAAPSRQATSHDDAETTEGIWVTPAAALGRCVARDLALPPPTWTTLRWLERFRNVESALEWARHKAVPRIQPGFVHDGETRMVILPGDPAMPAVPGFDARETRFVLDGGRWTPAS